MNLLLLRMVTPSRFYKNSVRAILKYRKASLYKTYFCDQISQHEIEPYSYSERFIPLTRRSLVRQLMQEKEFLQPKELPLYEDFANALDLVVVARYAGVLQELKSLFDPINPDKDTIGTRRATSRERVDAEFWLLQQLAGVLRAANFHRLPPDLLARALDDHHTDSGVRVRVNLEDYDVVHMWALGRDALTVRRLAWHKRLFNRLTSLLSTGPHSAGLHSTAARTDVYRRVVVACRVKGSTKLTLKAFKDVPVDRLEMMLPQGDIRMALIDRGTVGGMVGIAGLGVLAKMVAWLAAVTVNWTLALSAVAAGVAARATASYKNKRAAYLARLNRLLYFHNIANNRGLLTLLVDRAGDETFKECLLVYTFLLTHCRPKTMVETIADSLTSAELERKIEIWVKYKADKDIKFDSQVGVELAKSMGLVRETGTGALQPLALAQAASHLPHLVRGPQQPTPRLAEEDLTEGFDAQHTDEYDSMYEVWDPYAGVAGHVGGGAAVVPGWENPSLVASVQKKLVKKFRALLISSG